MEGILMYSIDINDNWTVREKDKDEVKNIDLPYDCMIREERSLESNGGTNTGWFIAKDYVFEKKLFVSEELKDKDVFIEFEGVYKDAKIYINDTLVSYRPYGYTNIIVDITDKLEFSKDNDIKVEVTNSDQPNSRWYSGTGIYRPVFIHVLPKKHILLNGIKVKTISLDPAIVEVDVKTNCKGKIIARVDDIEVKIETDGEVTFPIEIKDPKLWDVETPNLYTLNVRFEEDEQDISFGIRMISCNSKDGFVVNGRRVILLGCCIHADNGILGSCCYKESEYRKVKILKDAGYNAIRCAHNPCSKFFLQACDELGMYVMDEYVDMWYIHKTRYDYALHVKEYYERDIKDMIDKDYNHPSVIMYSLGNEVSETSNKEGAKFFASMQQVVHDNDYRPVTTGVNICFNFMNSLGMGFYSDEKAEKNPQKKVGSEFYNDLAGKLSAPLMKQVARLPGVDKATRDSFAEMDIAGYNYGIERYKKDCKKYPDRVILGSETFCSDAYRFYNIAKNNNQIIGDFVWAGMDYLGEVGVGSWEYKEYAKDFSHTVGWTTAGSGRVDLIGNELGEALYTKVALDRVNGPLIAVWPVNHTGEKHSPSAWKFTNAMPSYSFNGLDGNKCRVEVYTKAYKIELYINDQLVATNKRNKKTCRVVFNTIYQTGVIKAVEINKDGSKGNSSYLKSASDETRLTLLPEVKEAKVGDIVYIKIRYTDDQGIVKPLEHHQVKVKSLEGGKLLALGCAAPFNETLYNNDFTDTYYGQALAIIKVTGDLSLEISDGTLSSSCKLDCSK